MDVPAASAVSSQRSILPPAISTRAPVVSSAERVSRSSRDTEAIEGSASPRNPSVAMESRSLTSRSLLVAWRSKASMASSRDMPQPSSVTRISRRPPPSTSMRKRVTPASSEFSRSSLRTEAGRSTTSPAAILFASWSGRTRIRPIYLQYRDSPLLHELAGNAQQRQNITAVGHRLDHHVGLGINQVLLSLQHEKDLTGAELVFLVFGVHTQLGEVAGFDGQVNAGFAGFHLADGLQHFQPDLLLGAAGLQGVPFLIDEGVGHIR